MCTDVKCSASVPNALDDDARAAPGRPPKMKNLPHRGIAQIVGRQRILRFRDLLRSSPACYPRGSAWLRIGCAPCADTWPARTANATIARNFQCTFHGRRFTMVPEVNRFLKAKQAYHPGASPCPSRSGPVFRSFASCLACFRDALPCWRKHSAAPPPVTFTADQDHQNMMDQLGIKALRPGPKRQRESSQPRQLRRVQGQSLSQHSRSAHHERRQESDDAEDVVGQAPARNR